MLYLAVWLADPRQAHAGNPGPKLWGHVFQQYDAGAVERDNHIVQTRQGLGLVCDLGLSRIGRPLVDGSREGEPNGNVGPA